MTTTQCKVQLPCFLSNSKLEPKITVSSPSNSGTTALELELELEEVVGWAAAAQLERNSAAGLETSSAVLPLPFLPSVFFAGSFPEELVEADSVGLPRFRGAPGTVDPPRCSALLYGVVETVVEVEVATFQLAVPLAFTESVCG